LNESKEPTPESNPEPPLAAADEAQGTPDAPFKSDRSELFDRTTIIAFGVLFVLPAVIILFTVLFFLPYILSTLTANPSGASIPSPNLPPPGRP
jgi:hypothetical protein